MLTRPFHIKNLILSHWDGGGMTPRGTAIMEISFLCLTTVIRLFMKERIGVNSRVVRWKMPADQHETEIHYACSFAKA